MYDRNFDPAPDPRRKRGFWARLLHRMDRMGTLMILSRVRLRGPAGEQMSRNLINELMDGEEPTDGHGLPEADLSEEQRLAALERIHWDSP
jgi:hypothetical protein